MSLVGDIVLSDAAAQAVSNGSARRFFSEHVVFLGPPLTIADMRDILIGLHDPRIRCDEWRYWPFPQPDSEHVGLRLGETLATGRTCELRWYVMTKQTLTIKQFEEDSLYRELAKKKPATARFPYAVEICARHLLFFMKNGFLLDVNERVPCRDETRSGYQVAMENPSFCGRFRFSFIEVARREAEEPESWRMYSKKIIASLESPKRPAETPSI